MKWAIIVALASVMFTNTAASEQNSNPVVSDGYLSYPDIHGDRIVFVSEGDLWLAPVTGNAARRLTRGAGIEQYPKFSPDGRLIAFTGQYGGNQDVYVIASEGGELRRLTYHPDPDQVLAWRPDASAIIYRSFGQSPFWEFEAFSVPLDGGPPQRLPWPAVGQLSIAPDGNRAVVSHRSLEHANWKRYTGGQQEDLYLTDVAGSAFSKLTDYAGMDAFPMWGDELIYFISDRSGVANLHSMRFDGSDVRQLTHHETFSIRAASFGSQRIVYQIGGEVRLFDPQTEEDRAIPIRLGSDRAERQPRFVPAQDFLTEYELSPDGETLLLGSRGELFAVRLEQDRIIHLTRSAGVREMSASWLADGERILCLTDASGELELALIPAGGGPTTPVTRNSAGWRYPPVASPDGRRAAFSDKDGVLWICELASGALARVDEGGAWEIDEYSWSPDGRYLAYSKPEANTFRSIFIYHVSSARTIRITGPETEDHNPVFDPQGRYLYFLSDRELAPIGSDFDYEVAFSGTTRPYAVLLRAGARSPFEPGALDESASSDTDASPPEKRAKSRTKGKQVEDPVPEGLASVTVDEKGLMERVVPFPVPPGIYRGLAAREGSIFLLTKSIDESMREDSENGEPPSYTLVNIAVADPQPRAIVYGIRSYSLSADGGTVAFRPSSGAEVLIASTAIEEYDAAAGPDGGEGVKEAPLTQISVAVDPAVEWRQIFGEAWRFYRDFFWSRDMSGVPWDALLARYAPLLDKAGTRQELNLIIGELIGELNTSHAYAGGGDMGHPIFNPVGLLGADLSPAPDAGGYRIDRILEGELWEPDGRSPLRAPGSEVAEGEIIIAVDGESAAPPNNPFALLQLRAGQKVELTVKSGASKSEPRRVLVTTLEDDHALRYLDWVRRTRARVDRESGGRVGYIHVPDMMNRGLIAFSRAYYAQLDKPALIIDVRYNEGGYLSEVLLNRLQRQVAGYWRPRTGLTERYPYRAFHAHLAVLCNDGTSSDGEAFCRGVQNLKLGPVIGARSWGGLIGIKDDLELIDGGYLAVPNLAWWDPSRGWSVEGQGIIPDIPVENDLASLARGQDRQLERALSFLLDKVNTIPRDAPAPGPAPDRSLQGFISGAATPVR